MDIEDKIKVMKHYADGGKVRVVDFRGRSAIRHRDDCVGNHGLVWDWKSNTYSIVKEPKHIWVVEYDSICGGPRMNVIIPDDERDRKAYVQALAAGGCKVRSVDEYVSI